MKTTIDAAGRVVVPKAIRDELGFAPGTELELEIMNGRLEIAAPSCVRVEDGPHGPQVVADPPDRLTAEDVRRVLERVRP